MTIVDVEVEECSMDCKFREGKGCSLGKIKAKIKVGESHVEERDDLAFFRGYCKSMEAKE